MIWLLKERPVATIYGWPVDHLHLDQSSLIRAVLGSDMQRSHKKRKIEKLGGTAQTMARQQLLKNPIRMIHHFACTGGTVITKCLASMPDTHVLSEVEPHSRMDVSRTFAPTDLIQLLRVSSRPPSVDLVSKVFLSALQVIYDNCQVEGLNLLLRTHAHSQYCYGDTNSDLPSLLDMISSEYETLSIITVRHPLDSYLSLMNMRWIAFTPQTIEEYSKRYMRFLDNLSKYQIFKYENFIEDSEHFMKQVCCELKLNYCSGFTDSFGKHQLSGNSGRSSDKIVKHERRGIPKSLLAELSSAPNFDLLCERLGY